MLVRDQSGLAVLRFLEQGTQRLGGRQLDAQRKRVDEQPHHGLDAGNLRRPARHRDAEHHIVAAGQTAKQNRPGGLDEGVQGQTLLARLLGQRRGERLAQRQCDLLGRRQCPPWIMRRQTGRLLQSGQSLPPGRDGGGAILGRNPGQIIAVGGDPGQARRHHPCAHRG